MKALKSLLLFFTLMLTLMLVVGCQNKTSKQATTDNSKESTSTLTDDNSSSDKGTDSQEHQHTWSNWTTVKEATCTEEGIDERTCACGEKETRTFPAQHTLELVQLVPATKEATGLMEHYKCSKCNKLFNQSNVEVSQTDLVIDMLEGTLISDNVMAKLNGYGDVVVYDDTMEVEKSDLNGYLFGINSEGRIIYASYFSDSYGGPADGFYHDGSYNLVPGSICGIFDVSSEFEPYPAKTVKNGQEIFACTLFEVKVPTGGYLIHIFRDETNSSYQGSEFIKAITKNEEFLTETDNTLFEKTLNDGVLSTVCVEVTKGIKNASFIATKKAGKVNTLEYSGKQSGTFEEVEAGVYTATITLKQWDYISLLWNDEEGEPVEMWYDNTTFTGDITAADKIGADWTANLYHEEEKKLYCCVTTQPTYVLKYELATNTLTVLVTPAVVNVGSKSVKFEATSADIYEAIVPMSKWNYVTFNYFDTTGEKTTIWYDNATITGKVAAADKFGDQGDGSLYHEENEPYRFYYSGDETAGFKFVYNSTNKTLVVSQFSEPKFEYTGTNNGTFTKNEDGTFTQVISFKQWNNVAFKYTKDNGEVVDIWYDNTTITGKITAEDKLGDPWDGSLYHEAEEGQKWFYGSTATAYFKFTYNPTDNTLVVASVEPGLTYTGSVGNGKFTLNESGHYVTHVAFTQWKNINFIYTDSEGTETSLWYDNTTFEGLISAESKIGDPWDGSLYHEESHYWLYGGSKDFAFDYDPVSKTMVVSEYVEPSDNYLLVGETKVALDGLTVYKEGEEVTKGEYLIAVDKNGVVIYASRTGDYGGPADGFYHDGNYTLTPGSVCGAFDVDSRFAPYPNKVTIDGNEVGAWTLYKFVAPEGGFIVTGSQANMASLVMALTGVTEFNESNNALFEGLEDGSLTLKVTLVE